jgi:D-serine deaminase-like pyridoxal phosphate-dependent protein
MNFNEIKKPTLILDEKKCRANIGIMADKARSSGVIFRPHFKTHQSAEIGSWFNNEGVKSITVSSVTMAKHFAGSGWNNITIAFPINSREVDDIEKLAGSVNLNILISEFQQAVFLRERSNLRADYFIKIDTGYERCGIRWDDHPQIIRIIDELSNTASLRFIGFLTHSGHTYKAESTKNITDIYYDTLTKCTSLRALSSDAVILSAGDTPSCSVIGNFKGFDEIRPGNFVFYDLMQYFLGSCSLDQIALTVACPVVEKNHLRKEIIIYGGGVHLSKESIKTGDGKTVYGKAVKYTEDSWVHLSGDDFVRSVSQEHGIISASDELFKSINTGDIVGIIPVHSCMTADLLRQYHTFDGRIISGFSPK